MGWEEFVEEGCGAVEQDGFGSEEEVGIGGDGVLVAVELVLGQHGLVVRVAVDDICLEAPVIGEGGQLGEVGVVECVVVAEKEIGACQRRVAFEFLDAGSVSGCRKSGTTVYERCECLNRLRRRGENQWLMFDLLHHIQSTSSV